MELGISDDIRHSQRYITNYKKANWQLFRNIINDKLIINSKISIKVDVDYTVDQLENIIIEAKNKAIPEITIKPNAARCKYQRTRLDNYKKLKNSLTNEINSRIRDFNNKMWDKKLNKLSVKDNSIWKIAKSFTKKFDNLIPTLHGPNGLAFSEVDKVNTLAENFERVHHLTENDGDDETETICMYINIHWLQIVLSSQHLKILQY
ncbi:Protein of unknown function [Cotesia congregata]|uniref:Uncharacterized protein n=1 Tax=Cotesia congregata TaxID=51543 RepID=A0A8J2H828_COTCN|nr:Protein of unknown function [Cotesia congregata]